MELDHSFTVPATIDEAWDAFNQIESMAECFPGAVVTSVEGDSFTGTCKVKLGPISLVYSGSGTFLERDQAAGRFVVEAKGKDKRGNGTAGAKVTATIADAGDGSTKVDVHTDLQITGKPAQFGRGVIQDVSDKLLQQFVTCLQTKVGDAAATPAVEHASAVEPASAAEPTPEPATEPAPTSTSRTPTPERSEPASRAADNDALDLGATVVPILLKGYWKQLAGAAAGALIIVVLLRRVLRHR